MNDVSIKEIDRWIRIDERGIKKERIHNYGAIVLFLERIVGYDQSIVMGY